MNARELTDGGLVSTNTFWEVSIPVTVVSIIIPIAFSGLLIHMTTKGLRLLHRQWLVRWPFYLALNVVSAVLGGRTIFWVLWTANLLYTIELLRNIPASVHDWCSITKTFKEARAAKDATSIAMPNAADRVDQSIASQTRKSRETANSGQFADSWVTVQPSYNEDIGMIVHPSATESDENLTPRTSSSSCERERDLFQLRKNVTKIGIQVLSIVAIMSGGFILGTVFLVLDLLYHPESRATLSVYHSFALWMSILGLLDKSAVQAGSKCCYT